MLAVVVLVVAGALVPGTAQAQTNDSVDSWDTTFTVGTDGLLRVSETIVWRFGSNSGRHGIKRTLPTREPFGDEADKKDAVYDITDVSVTSPDASAAFTTSTDCEQGGPRDCSETLKIGDANTRITSATATYTIGYTVSGALRSSGDYDELYWDVVGSEAPTIDRLSVSVEVPGGVQETRCYSGAAGTSTECTSQAVVDGRGVFTQEPRTAGTVTTIGAKIAPGLVSDNQPHLEKARMSETAKASLAFLGVGGSCTIAAIVGLLLFWRNSRDERFADVPPGMVPAGTDDAPVRPDKKSDHETIPVRVVPPDVPVAVGGLLIDGRIGARETSAVLVDLAVRGAIQLRAEDDGERVYARLVDASRVDQPFEEEFLRTIFSNEKAEPGAEVALHKPGALLKAGEQLSSDVTYSATKSRLMKSAGKVGERGSAMLSTVLWWMIGLPILLGMFSLVGSGGMQFTPTKSAAAASVDPSAAAILGFVIPAVVFGIGCWQIHSRGQRTALGRAFTDQVDGFHEYLATAEADQIQFEEGRDIFSEYLPWAIALNLTNRWAQICRRLAEEGRLPATPPAWYYGDPAPFN